MNHRLALKKEGKNEEETKIKEKLEVFLRKGGGAF